MMRSMFAGVAGLRNHQIRMDAIGNNIANVNTVGYKGSRVSFQDTLNQMLRGASAPNDDRGGINALQIGLGMNIACIDILESQGNLQNTGRTTDVAIQGDGFFVVGDGQKQYYTRAGNFNLERDGRLVSASNGMIVQGWLADALGELNNNMPVTGIQLPLGQTISPIATTEIQFGGNLAANTNGKLDYPSMTLTDTSVPPLTATVKFKLIPKGFNTWDYEAEVANGYISLGTGKGTLTLNENGVVTNVTGVDFKVTPNGGKEINVAIPIGSRIDGGAFVGHATGTTQTNVLNTFNGNTGNFDFTVTDKAGQDSHIQYQITQVSGKHYSYQIIADPAILPTEDCDVTGGIGTFDWTLADGVTNVKGTDAVVTNTLIAGNTWTNTITPPLMMDGTPTFVINERAPEGVTLAPAGGFAGGLPPGSSQTYNIDVTNAAGEVLTTLNYTFTRTGGAEDYSWTLNSANGANITGSINGNCTWAAGNITAWTQANDTVLHTNSGVDIVIGPAALGVPFGLPAQLSGGSTYAGKFDMPDPVVTTTKVFDSVGNDHSLTTSAIKVGNNSWIWATVDENNNELGNGTLTFGSNGQYMSSTGGPLTFTPPGAQAISITPDFAKICQYAGNTDEDDMAISELNSPFQDGYPMGQLQSFNIDTQGRIIGIFSNGKNQQLGQIAMANFTNPAGLTRSGDTVFEESANSGTPQIGSAGQNGRGTFTPGAIEMSNVDLSQEFTDMITTQRGFQANSRIITTSDEMLQELVGLKR